MQDLSLGRLVKNSSYELTETGVRFKIFGIPYSLSEQDLDEAICFLMRMLERVKMIRKEKESLGQISSRP